jgi:nitrite reductase (NO-forming)
LLWVNTLVVSLPSSKADTLPAMRGHEDQVTPLALRPLDVYHCATPSVTQHIANGMYGLILVEPEAGLPRVDREYYVMQGEFYTKGKTLAPGLQPLDANKLSSERPEYVVFNGKMGALIGDNTLKTKVGETVRLFVGNGGPSLISSFHVIGEIFRHCVPRGNARWRRTRQERADDPDPRGWGGHRRDGSPVPGHFLLVDHRIVRSTEKGALGVLEVTGDEQPGIFKVLTPGTGRTGGH